MSGTFPVSGPSPPARAVAIAELSAAIAGAPAALPAPSPAGPAPLADLVLLSPEAAWQLAVEAPEGSMRALGALLDEFEQIESVAVNPAPRLLGELAGEIGAAADKLGTGVAALTPWLAAGPAPAPLPEKSGAAAAPPDRPALPTDGTHPASRALAGLLTRATAMAAAIAPRLVSAPRMPAPPLPVEPAQAAPVEEGPSAPPRSDETAGQHAPSVPQPAPDPGLPAARSHGADAPIPPAPMPEPPEALPKPPHAGLNEPRPAAPPPESQASPALHPDGAAGPALLRSPGLPHPEHREGPAAPRPAPEPDLPAGATPDDAPEAPESHGELARHIREAAAGMLQDAASGLTRMRQHLPPPEQPATPPGPAVPVRPRPPASREKPFSRSEAEHARCAAQIAFATAQVLQAMRRAAEPDRAELRRRHRYDILGRWVSTAAAQAARSRTLPIALALLPAGIGAWLLLRLDLGAARSAGAAALALGLLAWRLGGSRRRHLRLELRR